jgi:hypothetical protein
MAALKRRPALTAAIAVFALAALFLGLTRHPSQPPLPRQAAIHAALQRPWVHQALAGTRWDRVVVDGLDSQLDRVSFFRGGQVLAQVALRRNGTIAQAIDFKHLAVPYGDWIAYQPGLLIGLAALFVLLAGVAPWRRIRNLDVLFSLTLVAPVVLLQHRYIDASVLAALPGLLYLLGRCVFRALGPDPSPAAATPLLDVLTPGWGPDRRVRLLRILALTVALVFVMVTVSSVDAVDVVYAVMEGATKLLGGVLPYGHMPGDVLHGDTYPLLSYALYVPLAWLSPVHSVWDSVDLALAATVGAALLAAWAVLRSLTGRPKLRRRRRASAQALEREATGLRAALAFLVFPPVLVIASSGTTDVVLAAMLVLALVLWRRPGICTGLLAAAAWFKLAPLALVAVRLAPLRGSRLVRALGALAVVTVAMLALLVALGGTSGLMAMVHAISYQFSRGTPQSVWAALGIPTLQPVGEAAALALIAAAMVRLRRAPQQAEDRGRMAALSAAILIALQLVANYWAFLYVVWVVPLVVVSLLADRSLAPVPERVQALEPLAPEVLGAPVLTA